MLIIFTQNISSAQIIPETQDSVYAGNFLKTYLYNDVNLAYLSSVANYNYQYKKTGFTLTNNYLSNISKLNQNFIRDFNNFRFLIYYKISDNADAGAGFQNVFLTDEKNVEANTNKESFYFSNFDLTLQNNVFLNAKLGYKTEDQIGEKSSGPSAFISGQLNNYNLNDYIANGSLVLFHENLVSKQNHNYNLSLNVYKRFSQEADNKGSIRLYSLRNDFFFPATQSVINAYNVRNNTETRTENYFFAGDDLNYLLTGNLRMSLGGVYLKREILKEFKYRSSSSNILFENVYDTKILEDNFAFSGSLNYNLKKINSQLKLIYTERTENHSLLNTAGLTPSQISELEKTEKNKNNNSKSTSVVADILYILSNTNSFGFSGSTSFLKYDTDFELNYDDRDELETVASFIHNYNNLINFNIQTRFDLIYSKLSYIFSQKSANNYTNRIYRLTSQSNFTPVKKLSTRNTVQVLANYTVYDFEDIISQVQSFSYRQLSIKDSTQYSISGNFYFEFSGELKYYEQGQYNNSNFSVKPIAYFVEQLFNPEFKLILNSFAGAGIGLNYFQQNRYQYQNASRILVNTYRTFGPVAELNFYLQKNSVINVKGGINYIKQTAFLQDNTSLYILMNVLWNI